MAEKELDKQKAGALPLTDSLFCSKHNFQLCGQGWAKWSTESGEEGAKEEVPQEGARSCGRGRQHGSRELRGHPSWLPQLCPRW